MASTALAAAVDRVRTVFAGMTSPNETGCTHCYGEEEIALLRTPDEPLPEDLMISFVHKTPDHFTDHPAAFRRLLPQFTAYLASGRFEALGYGSIGHGRTGWHSWPEQQATAVDQFLNVWWLDTLATASPANSVDAVFAACADLRGTVTPMLDRWAAQPVGSLADAHLVETIDHWIDDLINDCLQRVTSSWYWFDREEPLAEIQAWVLAHAPARLWARNADPLLHFKIGLLALPYDGRWSEDVWANAPSTS
ncbi:hypothetical protein NLX86_03635 [Streptomyces sp. A3M-1-3]|uniref:hypothetical protein n=1 Tax=Streptomyces sp. A3M-1-3 TaxID=2962044 RepID=UPI0020B66057|nr:hypothetical protein [Streptomyces sp. A3M-1-3]MCP3817261.1 hypothetical protein [Streptomyces sp. A3M-1-3]